MLSPVENTGLTAFFFQHFFSFNILKDPFTILQFAQFLEKVRCNYLPLFLSMRLPLKKYACLQYFLYAFWIAVFGQDMFRQEIFCLFGWLFCTHPACCSLSASTLQCLSSIWKILSHSSNISSSLLIFITLLEFQLHINQNMFFYRLFMIWVNLFIPLCLKLVISIDFCSCS